MNLSDFPICRGMFNTDREEEENNGQGVLTGDEKIVTEDHVPPSAAIDPKPSVLDRNFSSKITASEENFDTMADLQKHRKDNHVLVHFTILPGGSDNNDDLKPSDQSSGTNDEHESHVAGEDSEKESMKESNVKETIKENSDGPVTVSWKGDPRPACEASAKRPGISEKIKNRRPTPWPADHLQSVRAAREAYELETKTKQGRAKRWRIAFLAVGALLLSHILLQRFFILFAFCRCSSVSITASQSAVSHAVQRTYRSAWHEIRGESLVREFLRTVRSMLPNHTPSTPFRWIYEIAFAALVIFLVWQSRFRRVSRRAILMRLPVQWWPPRWRAASRRHRQDRNDNADDHDEAPNGAKPAPDGHED